MTHAAIAIIGSGPAGLMAAETLATTGHKVVIYDRMPSPGRKFLLAGRGGLNLTHGEDLSRFVTRYGEAAQKLTPAISEYPPTAVVQWAEGLGQTTFTGSSGRVFPEAFKATPLLRAWLARLDGLGVRFAFRHLWTGWDDTGKLTFTTPEGPVHIDAKTTLLALGGASWPRLGSDGSWTKILSSKGIAVSPLKPANVGFSTQWSDFFRERFEGEPLKRIAIRFNGRTVRGEAIITGNGVEGGAVYAIGAVVRDEILHKGEATITIDLRPDLDEEALTRRLAVDRKRQSSSTFLRKAVALPPVAIALLREATGSNPPAESAALAALIKAVPLRLTGVAGIERAISMAGGVAFSAIDEFFMLRQQPGVFVAGEMIDWEAPTGGYLLQGCFSTGVAAARGILAFLEKRP